MWINSLHLAQAVRALRTGGVIACATEGVWGLGCDPEQPAAVQRLLDLKGRDPKKGFILVAGEMTQFSSYLAGLPAQIVARLRETWPGPVTWVVPVAEAGRPWISGKHASIALRVSAHPQLRALCLAFGGPLVSSSANPQGSRPARDALTVRRYFGAELDYILPGELGNRSRPSEIRDALSGAVLRPG